MGRVSKILDEPRVKFRKLAKYILEKTNIKSFCVAAAMDRATLYRLLYREHTPRLATARRIVELTAGYITYDDLLNKEQFKRDDVTLEELL